MTWDYQKAVLKTPLRGIDREILLAMCNHVGRPERSFRWALESIAAAADCSLRSARTKVRELAEAGYYTRETTGHDAYYFTLTDPAKWPAKPTAADMRAAKFAGRQELPGGRQKLPAIPVLNTSPEVTNVTSLPAAAGTVGGSESKVVCLEKARTELEPKLDTPPAKAKRAKRSRVDQDGELYVSANGLRLAHVRDLYHRYCCAPEGLDETPQDMPGVYKLHPKRQKAFEELCAELGPKATYQWFGMWFRWARANRWTNGAAPDNGWQADFDFLMRVGTLANCREKKYRRHDPEGYAHEADPSDDYIPAPANDAEARRAAR